MRLDCGDQSAQVPIAARLLVSDFEILGAAALAGLGIALLPAFQCVDDLRAHRLERVLRDWAAPSIPVHVVYPTARHLPAKVKLPGLVRRQRLDRDRTRGHGDAAATTVATGNSGHRDHDVAVMVAGIRTPGVLQARFGRTMKSLRCAQTGAGTLRAFAGAMRRGLMATGALVLAAACSSPDTPCAVKQVVTPSSSRDPGTLQYGVLHSRDRFGPSLWNSVAARSDGRVVCSTCSGIVAFDAMLRETGRVDGAFAIFASAPDDTVYALASGAILRMADLDHLSAASVQQWPAPVEPTITSVVVAGAEGPYTGMRIDSMFDASVPDPVVTGFDAMTGQPRTVASGQFLLAAVPGGGVLTAEGQLTQTATLRRLDPSGMVVWSRTLSSDSGLTIYGAAVAADASASVFGQSGSAVDFGDHTLSSSGWFVAGFDASGATQWAFPYALPKVGNFQNFITHIVQTADGALVIAGQEGVLGGSPPNVDSTLSLATPAGISRTLRVSGSGHQTIDGLAAAPDGAVWVYVSSFKDDYDIPGPVLYIGDHMFTDPGGYLFKIVP